VESRYHAPYQNLSGYKPGLRLELVGCAGETNGLLIGGDWWRVVVLLYIIDYVVLNSKRDNQKQRVTNLFFLLFSFLDYTGVELL
jgi:hypothetical protein